MADSHSIENERLRVTVSDLGAELVSVYDKARRTERIWTGEAQIWNRHAPILFPFVGKVTDGKYRIGEHTYAMTTQHGFARDRLFDCVEARDGAIMHCLAADDWTRTVYPFEFRLTVRHWLDAHAPGRLHVGWTVENTGDARMYYSIGGHPGFLLPHGVLKEDCSILFPYAETLRFISVNKAGYALDEVKALPTQDGRVLYRDDIPNTWIFEEGQVKRVGIAAPDGAPYVCLNCDQFPMLAVWANPKGPFICLEPWIGRTDDEGFSGTVDQKPGIQSLKAGKRQEISYSIDFY